jgi:hypothetical protein
VHLRNEWVTRPRAFQFDAASRICEHTFVTSPDEVAIALDRIGDRPIDPTNASMMGLTWRKALQRGLATEDELVAAARDQLDGSSDDAAA